MRSRRVNTTRCRATAAVTPVFQPGYRQVVGMDTADDEGGALATDRTLAAPVAVLCCCCC